MQTLCPVHIFFIKNIRSSCFGQRFIKIYQRVIFYKKLWPKVIWVSSRSLEEKNTKSVFGSYVNIFIKHWNLLNHTKAAFVQRAWYDFTEGFILRASSRFLEKQVQNSSLLNQDILKVPTAHKDCICLEGIYWFKTKVFWVSSGSLEKSANCVPDQYLTYGEA